MKKTTQPRIHALLASKAPKALVLRRGPSKQVAALSWDLETDEFTLGQWFQGRVYERRCDNSPLGQSYIFFASNVHCMGGKPRVALPALARAP